MTSTEKVALAMAWYDSGLEDRAAFQTLIESLLAQPEQEPHGWYIDGYGAVIGTAEPKSVRVGEWLPWYTSPPQRTWVGLTDEDIGDAYVAWDDTNGASFADFARAIEAKLKQKNGYAEENT